MKKRVLVAEDDPNIAFLIKVGLTDLGATFDVETVPSGEMALTKIKQGKWDLVVTDQRMPGITGLQLIEIIKQQIPSIQTILMTGHGSTEIDQAARRLHVHHYMIKPFSLTQLKSVIDEALAMNLNIEPPKPIV